MAVETTAIGKIPKLICQTYKSLQRLPGESSPRMSSWIRLNPEWVRPNCHRAPGRGVGWLLAATGFGKDLVPSGGAAILDISHWLSGWG